MSGLYFNGKMVADHAAHAYIWECPNCKNLMKFSMSWTNSELYHDIGAHYYDCKSKMMGDPSGSSYKQWVGNQLNNISMAQQGALQNGNWQTNQAIHGGSSSGTSNSAGGSALDATTVAALLRAGTRLPSFESPPPAKPLENTGIKFGEITGWRMWTLKKDNYLGSYGVGRTWAPHENMEGDPDDYGNKGIWAFKEKSRALHKMLENSAAIYGSVKLWGDIVEHEIGYRAQWAKVISIDDATGVADKNEVLTQLREKYLLPNAA